MNIKQISKISSRLSIFETNQICKLKNSFWKFGMISQRKWFKKMLRKIIFITLSKKIMKLLLIQCLEIVNMPKIKKIFILFI